MSAPCVPGLWRPSRTAPDRGPGLPLPSIFGLQWGGTGTCFRLAGRGHGKHLVATFFLAVALGLSVYGTPAHAAAHDYPPKERCTPAALWQDQGRWTQRYYNTHPIQLGWRVLNPRVTEGEKVKLELFSVGYNPAVAARGRQIVDQKKGDYILD